MHVCDIDCVSCLHTHNSNRKGFSSSISQYVVCFNKFYTGKGLMVRFFGHCEFIVLCNIQA